MSRPLLAWALAPVTVGAALLLQTSATVPSATARALAATLAALAALGGARAVGRRPGMAAALLLAAAALGAWAWGAALAARAIVDRLEPALEGVELRVAGVVDALPVALRHGTRFVLRPQACRVGRSGAPEPLGEARGGDRGADSEAGESRGRACRLPNRVSLSWQGSPRAPGAEPPPRPAPGERWSLRVSLQRPHAAVNFGAFDRELRWLEEGVGAVGRVRAGERLDAGVPGVRLAVERLRASIRDAIFDAAGEARAREAGVLAALAIGDQAAIDPALWATYAATGVGHLMSISGLHVTMLAGLGGAFAGWVWRRSSVARRGGPIAVPTPTLRLGVAVAVAFGYALLAGWGIPAQRTCLMLAVAAALVATGRCTSIGAAAGVAAVAIVALDPWAPLAAGFWLSFGAVLAIVWACAGERHGEGHVARSVRGALRTQWAATIALLPLGAWWFGTVSVAGPLANAVAIPLVSGVVTPLALAGGALALVSPGAGAMALVPAAALLAALNAVLDAVAAWPAAVVPLPRPGLAAVALACAGCVLMLAPRGVPWRGAGAAALAPLAFAPVARPSAHELWLTALDVGQGMAVVVQAGGRTLVYDTGPSMGPAADAGARVIVPWLRGEGIARPDAVVVSHADDDHAGGARSLLRTMPPDWLASSLPDDHPVAAAAPRAVRCRRGERWAWGAAEFEFLHPADPQEPSRGSRSNAASCVLRIRTPAGTALLAGDIEAAQERRLLELHGAAGLAADVLLVPHHGSRTSSTEAFVEAVAPGWAIVQAAYRSRFGHPHPSVLARFARHGAQVLRSDADGAVRIRLAPGAPPQVERARRSPARYWRVEVEPP